VTKSSKNMLEVEALDAVFWPAAKPSNTMRCRGMVRSKLGRCNWT
jgi:hypothetical protein